MAKKPRRSSKGSNGRPAFTATDPLRRKVAECAAAGMSQDDIARAIGCSTPTLVKHFEYELTTGAAVKRAEIIELMFKAARKGNVTAQKALDLKSQAAAAVQSLKDREGSGGAGAPPARETKLGKKEEQKRAAGQVEGKFAPPEGPKLVVNNR